MNKYMPLKMEDNTNEEVKKVEFNNSNANKESTNLPNYDNFNFKNNLNALAYNKKENIHKQLCDKIHDLYITKNNDYGDSVSDTFKKFGIDAYLVRMYDKINRAYTITRKEIKVTDETLQDTLLDLANYALITVTELKNLEK